MNEQVWWFVARSGGIVAWGLVTLSVCWGLFLSTKAASKAAQPAGLLDLHRFLGGLSVSFTAIHIVGLVADSYVEFGWLEILVPWASAWKPTAVAWGVIAFWLLLAVEATSLFMKKMPRRLWKQVHRASFGLYVFATVHGIQAGTDTLNQWFRMTMLASINIVAFLTVLVVLIHRRTPAVRVSA
jgi:predicted ferric reductase